MFLKPRQLTLAAFVVGSSLHAAPDWKTVESMLAAKCYECHNADKSKGDVDLQQFAADPKLSSEFELWQTVQDVVENGDMPPKKEARPNAAEAKNVLGLISGALARAGGPAPLALPLADPTPVPGHRALVLFPLQLLDDVLRPRQAHVDEPVR